MRLSRRHVLRGAGVSLALPWLEAMTARPARGARKKGTGRPTRMAVVYVPNGVNVEHFFPPRQTGTPTESGTDYPLPPTLEALAPHRADFQMLTGLAQHNAVPGADGPGDHARAMAAFMTGVRPNKTTGADIECGISFDQVAAQRIGRKTRLPSLELSLETGTRSGTCDSGYACVYSYHLSWASPTLPLDFESEPDMVFDRIIGVDKKIAQSRRSLLDFVREDAHQLAVNLGGRDRNKLDEFLTATREVEQRLRRFGSKKTRVPAGVARPDHPPVDTEERARMMADMIALAFEVDATRIVTLVMASEGSGRTFPSEGIYEGHHALSHHQENPVKLDAIAKIDRFYIRQLAYLLDKLKTTKDGDRPLLDSTMLLYGSCIGDGDRHNHHDLPIILAGLGNGSLKPGRVVRYRQHTPLNNLFLSLLDRMGAPTDKLGDSTGPLPDIG